MLLDELHAELIKLSLKLKQYMRGIEAIDVVSNSKYGYIVVLTALEDDLKAELLASKLRDLGGTRVFPDLWVFGPLVKQEEEKK